MTVSELQEKLSSLRFSTKGRQNHFCIIEPLLITLPIFVLVLHYLFCFKSNGAIFIDYKQNIFYFFCKTFFCLST